MKRSPLLKVPFLFAALLFGAASWVQYNDIDPEIYDHPSVVDAATWLMFYGFVALLFVVAMFRVLPRWLMMVAVVICLVQLGRTAPGMWENMTGDAPFTLTQTRMSSSDPRVELSREFLGALIALAALGGVAWVDRKRAVVGGGGR